MKTTSRRTDLMFEPMIATGEWLTEAIRRFDLDCAAETCPDMTLRQYRAILDGHGRLTGDTGSGLYYTEDAPPSPPESSSAPPKTAKGAARNA